MFHSISKWSIFVWSIFSVMSSNHKKWQVIYSILMIISCFYTIYITPQIICKLDGNCDDSLSTSLKGMFTRIVATTGLLSRLFIFLKGNTSLVKYKKHIDDFHILTPMSSSEADGLNKFSFRIVLCSILLVMPVNMMRLWNIRNISQDISLLIIEINFILMYLQNFSMYCIETHFTVLCFVLYQKFVGINRDLMALKINTNARNKYPFVLQTEEGKYGKNIYSNKYNRDILSSLEAGRSMTNCVEKLKAKHTLCRKAIKKLNNMFGIHLGFSLCSLSIYVTLDLYYYILGGWSIPKSKILIVGWILQYAVRFLVVTALAHMATKEALKSKIHITDINNRNLDIYTKEELQLFFNQICSSSVEFTACDFFTLNTHLITSAIAAGTTYLVILLQFNSSKD